MVTALEMYLKGNQKTNVSCMDMITKCLTNSGITSKKDIGKYCIHYYKANEINETLLEMESKGFIKSFFDSYAPESAKGKRKLLFQLLSSIKPQASSANVEIVSNQKQQPLPRFLNKKVAE